ncbi:MAG: threonylcarbamoyl-AMP synthase [Lachnospiraceae bacterium]|nr:threonylcarbamoyl-AMP synthase [Lachnospiraceae bacterium]
MNTLIFRTADTPLAKICDKAAEVFASGGLVAFPTETVYGLGANGLSADSSAKIFEAKGRPSDNPLILHIGEKEQLIPLVKEVPPEAELLIEHFWPGPLTIIFKKSEIVPYRTSGGLDTVAVRMPSHPVAAAMLKKTPLPIAAPSANLSGKPSTTRASHVLEDLNGRVDMIIDGGDVPIGVESTIIDMTQDRPVLLRYGYITLAEIEEVIGPVEVDLAIRAENIISHTADVERPKAPGMKYRHYAPKAPLTVVSGTEEEMVSMIRELADDAAGILTVDEHMECYPSGKTVTLGSMERPDEIAHRLFDALRSFDSLPVDRIYAEDLTRCDIGGAVMNRLLKAAGGNVIYPEKEDNPEEKEQIQEDL